MVWSVCRLYRQLSQDKMPDDATDTVESQVEELQKVAAKKLLLVVLDGVCSVVCLYEVMLFTLLQTCGMRSMSAHFLASTLPPPRSS